MNNSLPKGNIEILEKINSSSEKERLQAIAPNLRENEGVKARLRENVGVKVHFMPETFQLHELYATIDAEITGGEMKRMTYLLLPSDGQWRIANGKQG